MPSRHFSETAALTPAQRSESVGKIVSVAQKHKLTTAGIFSSSETVEGIFNSRGLNDWHAQTSAEISITMLAFDSSGWQKANSPNAANLSAERLAEIAASKAAESAAPREIAPGKYTVIPFTWNGMATISLSLCAFFTGQISVMRAFACGDAGAGHPA